MVKAEEFVKNCGLSLTGRESTILLMQEYAKKVLDHAALKAVAMMDDEWNPIVDKTSILKLKKHL